MARVVQSEQAMFVLVLHEAQAGNAAAQCELGIYYLLGKGVAVDFDQALFWLLKASRNGYCRAQSLLGNVYAREFQDYEKALSWYRLAARGGNAKARFNLGIMYQIGYGVEKDYAQAFAWQKLAAEQGFSFAQFNLGLLYADGKGTPQDDAQSFNWWLRAAEQNHPTAQYDIGCAYESGRGVARDMKTAIRWYRRAAHNGDYSAQVALASALLECADTANERKKEQAYLWMAVASRAQALPDTISLRFSDITRSLAADQARTLNQLAAELVGAIKPYNAGPSLVREPFSRVPEPH